MKKTAVIVFALVFALMAALSVTAADMTHSVGQLYVPFAPEAPKVDGKIDPDEWKNALKFTINDTNAKAVLQHGFAEVPTDVYLDCYVMWDEKYLYIAYDVTDPTKSYFTEYAWDGGDNIQLLLDLGPSLPGAVLNDSQQTGGNRGAMFSSAPQLKTDGTPGTALYCHQCVMNESVITDYSSVPFAAEITDHGWTFEEGIPWELLAADMKDKCGADVGKIGKGTEVTALLVYNDYNNHQLTNWFGTTKTGYTTEFSWEPDEHGIYLTLLGEGEKAPETTESSAPPTEEPETSEDPADNTSDVSDNTSDVTTESPAKASESTERPETTLPSQKDTDRNENVLIYILIAAGVVICGAIAAVIVLKKKKK